MATFPDTGRYTITNARFGNLAVLPDANDDSELVARTDNNDAGEKWNVTLLNNKKYILKNHGYSNFAACDSRPGKNDSVNGRNNQKQWRIKECRVKGQFTISPIDAELFWGLADGQPDTPVTLASVPNDTKNQWIFAKASV